MRSDTGFQLTPLGRGGVLLEPQHGINPADPGAAIDAILREVGEHQPERLYYSLAEVAIVDPTYYAFLNQLATACHALGIDMVGVGIRPHTAYSLAAHMEEAPRFTTAPGVDQP